MSIYTIQKYLNSYFITSKLTTNISFSLKRMDSDCNYVEVITGNIPPLNKVQLTIPKDGQYKLDFSFINPANNTPTSVPEFIQHFPNMQVRVIHDMIMVLCGDSCSDCANDCVTEELRNCIQYQNVFNGILVYANLVNMYNINLISTKKSFDQYIMKSCQKYGCDITNILQEQYYHQDFSANSEGTAQLFKILVAIYYVGFYLKEYNSAIDDKERAYVNMLFSYNTVKNCISNLNISTENLSDEYTNSIVNLNTAPTVDGLNIPLDTLPSTYTFKNSDFLTNYKDAEGDSPYQVKILSIPVNGTLKLNGIIVIPGTIINIVDLTKLVYTSEEVTNLSDPFDVVAFKVSDTRVDVSTSLYSDVAFIYFDVNLTPKVVTLTCPDGGILNYNPDNSVSKVISIPFTGGNGKHYDAQTIESTGVTGLTMYLQEGTLPIGDGNLTGYIEGIPSGDGIAEFAVVFGSQDCTMQVTTRHFSDPIIGDGMLSLNNRENYVFTVADFTTNTTPPYSDPTNSPLTHIKILSLGIDDGRLLFNGVAVVVDQIISIADIVSGYLTYMSILSDSASTDTFTWAGKNSRTNTFVS